MRGAQRLLIATASLTLSACAPAPPPAVLIAPPSPPLSEKVARLSPAEASAWIEAHPEGLIVDAREDAEFKNHGRIAKATNLSQLAGETTLATLEKESRNRPFLIYCALGERAALLAADLEQRGFVNLSILEGGFHAWKDAGLAVKR